LKPSDLASNGRGRLRRQRLSDLEVVRAALQGEGPEGGDSCRGSGL
jgi:hypothetical protein